MRCVPQRNLTWCAFKQPGRPRTERLSSQAGRMRAPTANHRLGEPPAVRYGGVRDLCTRPACINQGCPAYSLVLQLWPPARRVPRHGAGTPPPWPRVPCQGSATASGAAAQAAAPVCAAVRHNAWDGQRRPYARATARACGLERAGAALAVSSARAPAWSRDARRCHSLHSRRWCRCADTCTQGKACFRGPQRTGLRTVKYGRAA